VGTPAKKGEKNNKVVRQTPPPPKKKGNNRGPSKKKGKKRCLRGEKKMRKSRRLNEKSGDLQKGSKPRGESAFAASSEILFEPLDGRVELKTKVGEANKAVVEWLMGENAICLLERARSTKDQEKQS